MRLLVTVFSLSGPSYVMITGPFSKQIFDDAIK
jgi:hypothetical protein